jgi:hypothetical protein
MNHDQTFRVVLIAGWLILLPIAIYHRIQSQATGEKLDRRQEGLFILLTLRPLGIVNMLGAYRLHGTSVMDGLVINALAKLATVDWGRYRCCGRRVFYLEPPHSGKESDGHSCYQKKAFGVAMPRKAPGIALISWGKSVLSGSGTLDRHRQSEPEAYPLPFACGQRSVKAPSRRVFSEEGSEDREAKESGHVQNTRCGEEARKSGAVL